MMIDMQQQSRERFDREAKSFAPTLGKPLMYLGCDPGKSGAVAMLQPNGDPGCELRLDVTANEKFEVSELLEARQWYHVYAVVEKVGPGVFRPGAKMGASSAFTFGMWYGKLLGTLETAQIPFELVTPQRWQKTLGCMTGGDKHASQSRARQLFPKAKCTLKNSDAILLAEYCRRLFSNNDLLRAQ